MIRAQRENARERVRVEMATDIVVPTLGESVTEATVAQWLKQPGEAVAVDEPVVELETDKVTLEVNASVAGVLSEVIAATGENVEVGAVLGRIGEGEGAQKPAAAPKQEAKEKAQPAAKEETSKAEAKPASKEAAAGSNGETLDVTVPALGESVSEATVAKWLKQPGESVGADEPLVELETDKVTLEVNAPAAGTLKSIAAEEGATVEVGALLGVFAAGGAATAPAKDDVPSKAEASAAPPVKTGTPKPAAEPAAPAGDSKKLDPAAAPRTGGKITKADLMAFLESSAVGDLGPAVRKLVAENELDPAVIPASGKDGRLTKEDVLNFLEGKAKPLATPVKAATAEAKAPTPSAPAASGKREERVRMTKLRQTIARRLKEAQNTAALLTTFNECDMSAVMALRSQYKDAFEKKHGVKLGFSSFFTKAVVGALQEVPAVNARIDGEEIVYNHYYDIGMAVSTPNGLMVPVMRDCDKKSFAEIEKALGELAVKGRDGKISLDEMTGGTFTITNGGVFGSMMSTPILNMPQAAILGLHKIQERPVAVSGKVEIRPMMYLALSYDHRIIDGREAVTFLVRVKEAIEDPQRLLIGM
ncbi:MAG: 2-oxoglutarate dehydrogenase complex dihydrolipoyllysine-residue succinyltransferase [Kiloniellaceae bacterium]